MGQSFCQSGETGKPNRQVSFPVQAGLVSRECFSKSHPMSFLPGKGLLKRREIFRRYPFHHTGQGNELNETGGVLLLKKGSEKRKKLLKAEYQKCIGSTNKPKKATDSKRFGRYVPG